MDDLTPRTIPALDGIRGLAILSVMWFHFAPHQMPGGWMGMSIFFPLSGFLVTRLLLRGVGDGRVDLVDFWRRRARRLFPALWVMLAVTAAIVLVHGTWGSDDRGAVLSSLLYVNNWWQLGTSVDYWAATRGLSSPFEHLWSLSVEEQFYLVWPLVAWLVARRGRIVSLGRVAVALAVAGAAFGLVWSSLADVSLTGVYYHTGVRAAELMAGSAAAVFVHRRGNRPSPVLEVVAVVVLAVDVLLWFGLRPSASETFVHAGGMAWTGLGTCALIVAATGGGTVATTLSMPWLRWLGTRCYSLYLWHWPVVVFVDRASTGLSGGSLLVLRVVLTLAATVLSYSLVEERFRLRR